MGFIFFVKFHLWKITDNFVVGGGIVLSKKQSNNVIVRKPFDLAEAIILLDVYITYCKNGLTNSEAAVIASNRLRTFARKRGLEIDDGFRSSIGIQNRLRSIGHVFEKSESFSTPATKVFAEAVDLYNSNRTEYERILKDSLKSKTKKDSSNVKNTKYVMTTKDGMLKTSYGEKYDSVYCVLKQLSQKNVDGCTPTELFLFLNKNIKKKDIINILKQASWSKSVGNVRYIFYDKELEERKKKQMEEQLKIAEQEFLEWLPSAVAPSYIDDIKKSLKSISIILVKKKIIDQPLVITKQIGQIENALRMSKSVFGSKKMRNIANRLLNAYLEFIREKKKKVSPKDVSHTITIQDDWIHFDFTNAKQFERTVPACCFINGIEFKAKSWARMLVAIVEKEIADKNSNIDLLYKKSLISQRSNRPFFMKKKIEGQHFAELSNGYWINVNRNIPGLIELIYAFCLQCGYRKNDILIYGIKKEKSSVNIHDSISKSDEISIDKVEEYVATKGLDGATIQEVINTVQPDAATYRMQKLLKSSEKIMEMSDNRFVHADAFVDLDEASDGILRILEMHFKHFGGYSNNKILFGAASIELSMFLNDNDCEDIDSVYTIARHLFAQKFIFSYPHIFEKKPDFPLTLKGLIINLARLNDGVLNIEDAKEYLDKIMLSYGSINQLLQTNSSDTFVYYDGSRFLLTEKMGIDGNFKKDLHYRLDELFRQADVAYVIPRDINDNWLQMLPALPHGLPWTILLLQEILKKYSDIGFKTIGSELAQSYDTIAAAIVPLNSQLESFADVVTLYMQEKYILPKRMSCDRLRKELLEAGMIEGRELIYALPKALNDYRFSWTDENKMVLVRGN